MGCCYSCGEESSSQTNEPNERTHLLVDPVSGIRETERVDNDDYVPKYPSPLPKKTDEQSALNRILQENATNVIDVAALESHNLEQHEYAERIRHYVKRIQAQSQTSSQNIHSQFNSIINQRETSTMNSRVQQNNTTIVTNINGGDNLTCLSKMLTSSEFLTPCLLVDITNAEKMLASDPISQDDLNFIQQSVLKASQCIQQLSIQHKEDLVVPFNLA